MCDENALYISSNCVLLSNCILLKHLTKKNAIMLRVISMAFVSLTLVFSCSLDGFFSRTLAISLRSLSWSLALLLAFSHPLALSRASLSLALPRSPSPSYTNTCLSSLSHPCRLLRVRSLSRVPPSSTVHSLSQLRSSRSLHSFYLKELGIQITLTPLYVCVCVLYLGACVDQVPCGHVCVCGDCVGSLSRDCPM